MATITITYVSSRRDGLIAADCSHPSEKPADPGVLIPITPNRDVVGVPDACLMTSPSSGLSWSASCWRTQALLTDLSLSLNVC